MASQRVQALAQFLFINNRRSGPFLLALLSRRQVLCQPGARLTQIPLHRSISDAQHCRDFRDGQIVLVVQDDTCSLLRREVTQCGQHDLLFQHLVGRVRRHLSAPE